MTVFVLAQHFQHEEQGAGARNEVVQRGSTHMLVRGCCSALLDLREAERGRRSLRVGVCLVSWGGSALISDF